MNNAIFRKTMMNVRRQRNQASNNRYKRKLFSLRRKPSYNTFFFLNIDYKKNPKKLHMLLS